MATTSKMSEAGEESCRQQQRQSYTKCRRSLKRLNNGEANAAVACLLGPSLSIREVTSIGPRGKRQLPPSCSSQAELTHLL